MRFKEKEGITLIALVVTIIVLIILAGVSINLLFGQYGVVTKAKDACMLVNDVKQIHINIQIILLNLFLLYATINSILFSFGVK